MTEAEASALKTDDSRDRSNHLAIIGLAGRFPGADNADQFWKNLRDGVESITRSSRNRVSNDTQYVEATGLLNDIEMFDADFFSIPPREAQIMNPQHRLALECAWEVLELAGYAPRTYPGRIGVFLGSGGYSYLLSVLLRNRGDLPLVDDFQLGVGNHSDFLPTRVSYKLNLRGPSVAVQTACSTSLVAVHLASQSLLHDECDLALAGGVSIQVPQHSRSPRQEGGIFSPDGHCRAFDARACGTVSSNGLGIVVLKRLTNALADRDNIRAVIIGSAVNNDGSLKVGYTAPSVAGQASVIAAALDAAGVTSDTISYVEAHGTGTSLGDPIEVAALAEAFSAQTNRRGFCALGSVKTNIGHLDAAAGVTGLIKTVMAVEHCAIPGSLHFESPNPEIDFDNSPFYVNRSTVQWPDTPWPRRAGISSFGIGGTNAHVIIEEAPAIECNTPPDPWNLLLLSAKTSSAVTKATERLVRFLQENPESNLSDVAYTLQVGRRAFNHRRMVVCQNMEDALRTLEPIDPVRVHSSESSNHHCPVVFMFPGYGCQYAGMMSELYQEYASFREDVESCVQLLPQHLESVVRQILKESAPEKLAEIDNFLEQSSIAHPTLFIAEYALTRLLLNAGIRPSALIGYSLGEYVAACVADVLSLADALRLVTMRGKLMEELPQGAMIMVPLHASEIRGMLNSELSVAAINGDSVCVVSGPIHAAKDFCDALEARGVNYRRLRVTHAFHSSMMDPIVRPYLEIVSKVELKPPKIPYISNVTGTWITASDVTDPGYWTAHMRQTVLFSEGLATLLSMRGAILLEVGPGHGLGNLAKRHSAAPEELVALPTVRRQEEKVADVAFFLNTLGQLWIAGVEIDWSSLHAGKCRRRVPLPTYPFERRPYWVGPLGHDELRQTEDQSMTWEPSSNLDRRQSDEGDTLVPQDFATAEAESGHAGLPAVAPGSDWIASELRGLLGELLGIDPRDIVSGRTFIEMGAESLLLLQASQAIRDRFGVKVPFRMLIEELATVDALASYLSREQVSSEQPTRVSPPTQAMPGSERSLLPRHSDLVRSPTDSRVLDPALPPIESHGTDSLEYVGRSGVEGVIERQLQIIAEQLRLLHDSQTRGARRSSTTYTADTRAIQELQGWGKGAVAPSPKQISGDDPAVGRPIHLPGNHRGVDEAAVAISHYTSNFPAAIQLTTAQQAHLMNLTRRLDQRLIGSKRFSQTYRTCLADSRMSAGFQMAIKELIYPVVATHGAAGRLWDVDGNEYVDIAMGFGSLLFGHSPSFVMSAIEQQLKQGMLLGPQTHLAGEAASLLCNLTNAERAMFCNSGTEAVMTSLRLARAITGRRKVAVFTDSYHGTFDGVLAMAGRAGGGVASAMPKFPGVVGSLVEDTIVVDYGVTESLDILRSYAHELAAVLIEPVQSRHQDRKAPWFLRDLRRLADEQGIALIFDEVITGFRLHPKGAQGMFGVQADMSIYGKSLGNGMPVAAVVGTAKFLDAVDGGRWNYQDGSYPSAIQTFATGTYWNHPLVLSAVVAILRHLLEQGPALQEQLTSLASHLTSKLDACFEYYQAPIRMSGFGSLFSFTPSSDIPIPDVFFYLLREKGVYTWEGPTCYLSTAHTREDLEHIERSVEETVAELRDAEFFSR